MHPNHIQELSLQGKKVLMRVDFNVPMNKQGEITDDTRIQTALISIQYVLKQGASLVLISHLGRPKGRKNPKLTLLPCAKRLAELLNQPVEFAEDCIGDQAEAAAEKLQAGEVLLLENLRFHQAEENPSFDPNFAKNLAKLGDVYINEAFASSHRKHSSIYAIPRFYKGERGIGFLFDREIAFLGNAVEHPKRPFYAIIGGSKISSKIGVLKKLVENVDSIFIGGGMTFTFLKAEGIKIGKSICEDELIKTAKEIISLCKQKAVKLHLPQDLVIATECQEKAQTKIVSTKEGIQDGWMGVDIGPKTIEEWQLAFAKSGTVFWNGPLGVFEIPDFAKGTFEIARNLSSINGTTIVGGGDSIAAIHCIGLDDKFTHISTGGGATLEFLEFGSLPGIDILCQD